MDNNKVSNPQTEVPQTPQMNDKDYLQDILETEKNMINNYSYALNEASNDTLHDEIMAFFKKTCAIQRELFNLTFKKGWYSLERSEQYKIEQKYNEYNGKINELPQ